MQQYFWCLLEVVFSLQDVLHQHNLLTRSFKQAAELVTFGDYRVVLSADKVAMGEHAGIYNAPTSAEVAVLLVGQEHGQREIVLQYQDNTIKPISETNRAYDALQYPLILWQGQDGYHFKIPQNIKSTLF